MTFEQWYKKSFPGDWNLAILAKSPGSIERYEQAKAAWEAGYEAGGRAQVEWQDYLDRYDD